MSGLCSSRLVCSLVEAKCAPGERHVLHAIGQCPERWGEEEVLSPRLPSDRRSMKG